MTVPDGERIAVLETKFNSIIEELKEQRTMIKDQGVIITGMHDILTQAKGAKWVIVAGATVAGAILTYLPWLASYLGLVKNG